MAPVPTGSYRVQLTAAMGFASVTRLLPYLERLGISHVYLSPVFAARAGSPHGYDICDHNRLSPELGTREEFDALTTALNAHGLALILDIVPNHMGIDPEANGWWRDVLEHGQSSAFAEYFDIDWHPVKPELHSKVLLPILQEQYGVALEDGLLRLEVDARDRIVLTYRGTSLPLSPRSLPSLIAPALASLVAGAGADSAVVLELRQVLEAFARLPPPGTGEAGLLASARRESEAGRRHLHELCSREPAVRAALVAELGVVNGRRSDPASFDRLHALLEQQAYRLASWRTAAHEINYRRFFDVNELAALQMEREEVFAATHGLVQELVTSGQVSGLRVDHVDGLFDPATYLERLSRIGGDGAHGGDAPVYVVVEKILSGEESLGDWPVAGTTGYDFLNDVNAVFVAAHHARRFRAIGRRFTGRTPAFEDVAYRAKRLIMRTTLGSELNVLAHALNRLSEENRRTRDFTLHSLRDVLVEYVACLTVYRTYVTGAGWTPEDRAHVDAAVTRARARNPALEPSAFDFLREVLLPRPAVGSVERWPVDTERRHGYPPASPLERERRLRFAQHLQQYTGAVQAKGVEDTAFYIDTQLISLNEVGGEPSRFGSSTARLHARNARRRGRWPRAMLATATHDSKLGEDVRARLNAVSELPDDWRRVLGRYARATTRYRTRVGSAWAPDRNDEYRFIQVLCGSCPFELLGPEGPAHVPDTYVGRLREYMRKATKEGKVHTSWIADNAAYDDAVSRYVGGVLSSDGWRRLRADVLPFFARVARLGVVNALSQLVLKLGSPGVPDVYQGTEFWDLSLVDPDNRRPVAFHTLSHALAELGAGGTPTDALKATWRANQLDPRVKLGVLARALSLRRLTPRLFLDGDYRPVEVRGPWRDHAVAFARVHDHQAVIVVVPRFTATLPDEWWSDAARAWAGTVIDLPVSGAWVNVLTGAAVAGRETHERELPLAAILEGFPVALLFTRAITG